MKTDQQFFERLLDLCLEYKVNIENADIQIGSLFDVHRNIYKYVNVTGQWEISKGNSAIEGELIVKPAITEELSIKGRK